MLLMMKQMRSNRVNLMLVNLAAMMEGADGALLPGVYKEVGEDLHIDPTRLSSLTLFRSIVQTSCYPLAAYLAIHHNRAHVIALGAFLWAITTFLFAISSTFFQVALWRALNGIGLAIVIPSIQSLVADSTYENNRGMAFGWLQFIWSLGTILGNLCAILLASRSFMGIPGWRIAFHLVGIVSVIVGILVRLFAFDPRFLDVDDKPKDKILRKSFWLELNEVIEETKFVIRIPSFQIIVAQGVPGSFPMSAWVFAPMWFELIGFSHETTAILMTIFVIANSLGGLFGGKMGDLLSQQMPNSGRIMLSQISSGSGIPLAAILLLGLPDEPSTAFMHGLVLFILGFCRSWNGPATNNPIFAEIVPEKHRTSIYALDRLFESVLKSFAPLMVGLLTQHVYGYKLIPKGSTGSEKIKTGRENAVSMAKALFMACGIPMALCCVIYSFLYCTYPKDKERARMQALTESAVQLMQQSHDQDERCIKGRCSDESNEFDDSDERTLFSAG
ncbi:hypothetical protein Nepgr_027159 [Nepenthes gracilis]|uniref:Major facilitator superfamily (MFS) profile domain-containing protein n=1 Tax=Nepenthes gracilis TaxID=150966 RepID=A0AAD3TA02_NEPGR|nr:hypothetical protein Nepgr_027159 [Nepenthes gracilis]